MKSKVISKVKIAENREVRISRINTGLPEDLVRIGINLLPGGENMSGAVFPASLVDDVVATLKKV